ncbi:MAG TPA: YcaO-like family protein [Sinorhizobium sp.]|nr:YcaO-like family protein [Sinorhizobium sp.]
MVVRRQARASKSGRADPRAPDEITTVPDGRIGPDPREMLAHLLPVIATMGITRLADITGLDRFGVPVIQAVRPQSLSNSVSQGKGRTPERAAVSAILEAAETCFAERVASFEIAVASADALQVPVGWFESALSPDASAHWRENPTAWVCGRDLISGRDHMVPFELVHTAYVEPPLPHDGLFDGSTSGLAVAFTETDAILHGVLECLERDAIAKAQRTHGFLQRNRIDPGTIEDDAARDLLQSAEDAGLLVGLWHADTAIGVPTIWCHAMERDAGQAMLVPQPADGSAASLDPRSAVCRAIEEAAQSRLAAISGARDDMTRQYYPRYPDWALIEAHRRLLAEGPCPVDLRRIRRHEPGAGDGWLSALLSDLSARPKTHVLVVPIGTDPLDDLAAVKVIIPALESLH